MVKKQSLMSMNKQSLQYSSISIDFMIFHAPEKSTAVRFTYRKKIAVTGSMYHVPVKEHFNCMQTRIGRFAEYTNQQA